MSFAGASGDELIFTRLWGGRAFLEVNQRQTFPAEVRMMGPSEQSTEQV